MNNLIELHKYIKKYYTQIIRKCLINFKTVSLMQLLTKLKERLNV